VPGHFVAVGSWALLKPQNHIPSPDPRRPERERHVITLSTSSVYDFSGQNLGLRAILGAAIKKCQTNRPFPARAPDCLIPGLIGQQWILRWHGNRADQRAGRKSTRAIGVRLAPTRLRITLRLGSSCQRERVRLGTGVFYCFFDVAGPKQIAQRAYI
jgi:hypothetical protein